MPGLYRVVRRAYTVASFADLSWLVHGGCTAGNVIYVSLILCSSSFGTLQEDNERTRRRENPGEGQKEDRRRRGGGQEKTGRRPGRGPPPPKSQSSSMWFCIFCSIVFHSILFDLN